MTTFDPGASDVFTHGLVASPRSTAFFASRPAATITDGFDVLVQLVIAAITTEPFFTSGDGVRRGRVADAGVAVEHGPAPAFFFGFVRLGSASSNDFRAVEQATRSCGRFGPGEARLDAGRDPGRQTLGVLGLGRGAAVEEALLARVGLDQLDLSAADRPVRRR